MSDNEKLTEEDEFACIGKKDLTDLMDAVYKQIESIKVSNPNQFATYYKETLKNHIIGKYYATKTDSEEKDK